MRDRYFDHSHQLISREEAVRLLSEAGKCIIKPSVDSDSGRGVRVLILENGKDVKTNQGIEEVLASYQKDYLIQQFVKVHESIKTLNPSSVNTFRIVTYICNSKVFHSPLAMRIGAGDAEVDNIHAGGLVIGVSDSGVLNEYAFSEYGKKVYQHPTSGITFKGYKIPNVQNAINLVEQMHLMVPRLTFISWDVTIQENGEPVIIEMNTRNQSAWFPQMVNGKSLFEKNTKEMIRMINKKRNRF